MKNKITMLVIFGMMISLSLIGMAMAAEGCFYKILINESAGAGDSSNFALVKPWGIESVWGDYKPNYYSAALPEDYIITASKFGSTDLIGTFSARTSRLMYYDDFGDPDSPIQIMSGGSLLTDNGIIEVIVPGTSDLGTLKINDGNKVTELWPGSYAGNSRIRCTAYCVGKDGKGSYSVAEKGNEGMCCAGLIPRKVSETEFTCTKCGDGVCSQYEDSYTCKYDCKEAKPYSRILSGNNVVGELSITAEKKGDRGLWQALKKVNTTVSLQALKEVNLSGLWNGAGFSARDAGLYRLRATFSVSGQIVKESYYEFEVEGRNVILDSSNARKNGYGYGNKIVEGKIGNASDFGYGDYYTCIVPRSTKGNIEFWFKAGDAGRNNDLMVISEGAKDYFVIRRHASDKIQLLIVDNGAVKVNILSKENIVNDMQWHHIAVVQDGSNAKIYVDGVLSAGQSFANSNYWTSFMTIKSCMSNAGDWHINGALDELRTYTRAASAAEVKAHYEGRFVDNTGLYQYFKFE